MTLHPQSDKDTSRSIDSLSDEQETLVAKDALLQPDERPSLAPTHVDAITLPPNFAPDSAGIAAMESGKSVKVSYFGDYELLEEIARGGMGVVYKARQVNLNRIVALKMILSGQLASEDDIKRFYIEAEAAAKLDHPNIVPIFEIGNHNDQHYFSMGFIEGQSLEHRVKIGPLPPKSAAELTKTIAEAMAFAHSKGVVHRDLKPANVLIDTAGVPKVTDFGLAKKVDGDSGLTRTGTVMGTPSYMPPEQAAGQTDEVGPLADVYSLGAILYCLVSGRPPFQGASAFDTLLQVIEREPLPPSLLNSQVPKDLETICLKCLQKDPAKRYLSADEMALDLGRWLRGEPIRARAVSRMERAVRWVNRNRVTSCLFAITLLTLVIGTIASTVFGINALKARDKAEAVSARSNYFLALARWDAGRTGEGIQLLEQIPERHRKFEWHLARAQFDESQLTFKGNLGQGVDELASPHTDPIEVSDVFYSPDNECVAAGYSDGTVVTWDFPNGRIKSSFQTEVRARGVRRCQLAFSPDGEQIISTSNATGRIAVWDVKTGQKIHQWNGLGVAVGCLAFSWDGSQILVGTDSFSSMLIGEDPPAGSNRIDILDSKSGNLMRSFGDIEAGIVSLRLNPDGNRLLSLDGQGDVVVRSLFDGTVVSKFQGDLPVFMGADYLATVRSPDGSGVVHDGIIHIWNATTGEMVKRVDVNSLVVKRMAVSSDGNLLAVANQDGSLHIWDANEGKQLRSFQGHTGRITYLKFSQEGSKLISGADDGSVKVWNLAAPSFSRTVAQGVSSFSGISLTSDGNRVLYESGGNLCVSDVNTGELLTKSLSGHPYVVLGLSPNGRFMASARGADYTTSEVSVLDFLIKISDSETGSELHTCSGHSKRLIEIRFSPDSSQLLSVDQGGTLIVWDTATGKQRIKIDDNRRLKRGAFFSSDSKNIIAYKQGLKQWDSATGLELPRFPRLSDSIGIEFIDISPDGRLLALGTLESSIKLLDLQTNKELPSLKGHLRPATSVALSNDGTRLLSCSRDNTIKLWDVTTGEELRSIHAAADNLKFGPDDSWFVTVHNGVIRKRNASDDPVHRLSPEIEALEQRVWHDEQLALAKERGDWYSRVFHWAWLLHLNSDGVPIPDEFRQAYRRLQSQGVGQSPEIPPSIAARVVSEEAELPNVFSGGSFEEESTVVWTTQSYLQRPESAQITTEQAWTGKRSLEIRSLEGDDVEYLQTVKVEPNSRYRIRGWVKTENVVVTQQVGTVGACLSVTDVGISDWVVGTADWTPLNLEFATGERTEVQVGPRLGYNGSTCSGTAWFDDLRLEKVQ